MNVEYREMEVPAMVTARDIKDIQALQPDEQVLVLSLVKSFINSRGKRNDRSEEHTSELQSLFTISYAVSLIGRAHV